MRKSFAALAGLVALLPTASAAWGFPDATTERGRIVEDLYVPIVLIAIAVFLLVVALLGYVILRFREGTGHGKATYEKERHNLKAEIFWTVVPLLIVGWVGVASYQGMVALDAPKHDGTVPAFELGISGSQWNWEATYPKLAQYPAAAAVRSDPNLSPDHGGEVLPENAFLIPADTPILFNITATDVIHAFGIFDANGSYFGMNDANPLGSNKFATEVYTFPEGNYTVRCKEMCLNPGHAYMRATIRPVPQAEYDHWLAGKSAAQGAKLLLPGGPIPLASGGDGLARPGVTGILNGTLRVATTTRIIFDITDNFAPVTLTVNGEAAKTITGGPDTFYAFDASTAGTYEFKGSNGGNLTIVAVEPDEVRTVRAYDYRFDPKDLQFEVGKTYQVNLENLGGATHDLHFGVYEDGVDLAFTGLVSPNGVISVIFTPTTTGKLDIWCAPHVGMGMRGTATVS